MWEVAELSPSSSKVRMLCVEDFPVIVANDIYGNDLLDQGKAEWRKDIPAAL